MFGRTARIKTIIPNVIRDRVTFGGKSAIGRGRERSGGEDPDGLILDHRAQRDGQE